MLTGLLLGFIVQIQIPDILKLAKLHVIVDVVELLPDATHCFYNLAGSWFWLEKSDLKQKQCLTYFTFCQSEAPAALTEPSLHFRKQMQTVHRAALTWITVALFGVVALSREATCMPLPDLLFFPLFLQDELPQTGLDLHGTHTHIHTNVFTSACNANMYWCIILEFFRDISHQPC